MTQTDSEIAEQGFHRFATVVATSTVDARSRLPDRYGADLHLTEAIVARRELAVDLLRRTQRCR